MIGLLSNLPISFVVNINFRNDTWKGAKDTRKRTSRKHFLKRRKSRLNGKAHQNTELDPSVTMERIRVQRRTHHAKAVARGPTSGAVAPWCGRTPRGGNSVPPFLGSCMAACIGWFHLLQNLYHPEPSYGAIN